MSPFSVCQAPRAPAPLFVIIFRFNISSPSSSYATLSATVTFVSRHPSGLFPSDNIAPAIFHILSLIGAKILVEVNFD